MPYNHMLSTSTHSSFAALATRSSTMFRVLWRRISLTNGFFSAAYELVYLLLCE
jgi:hypothetical protein